jgi:CheY-like chemotaxis protein
MPVTPQVLHLGAVVRETEKMLRRLIGEDVLLSVDVDPGLGEVEIDAGQVEQIVMNLAANARDAMPHGGKLTIEAANVSVGEDEARARPGTSSGRYVRLSVADTGAGMDAATRARIFEPFFTTKDVGKGTGLGLAVVYGIVRQNRGTITVESEPGRGTRFDIDFPCVDAPVQAGPVAPAPLDGPLPRGAETLLLVEDDEDVRRVVRESLASLGYTVLETGDPVQALRIAERHAGAIDLLVSDVVMADMRGPELAERLRPRRPGMATLFMSGYPGVIPPAFADGTPTRYLLKPVSRAALARTVRQILDESPRRPRPGAQA